MTQETKKVLNYIKMNTKYKGQIAIQRRTYSNLKDFTNQVSYIVKTMVDNEEKLFGINRKKIDVYFIAQELF